MVALVVARPEVNAAEKMTLEALKREFPGHTVGPVTDKSDPAIVQCFSKYKSRVEALGEPNLPQKIQRFKDEIAQETREIEFRLQNPKLLMRSSTRFAEQKNLSWLRMKLTPYAKKIEAFQRGR